MDRAADLAVALSFVIRRVEEQAKQSGEPLSDEQRLLLHNLTPSLSMPAWDPEFQELVPRNIDYEQLCALGKKARLHDLELSPVSLDWEFAFAVFHLNNHPMWGLLQNAGLRYHRPLWDQFLVIIAALLFIAVMMVLMPFGAEPWTPFQWVRVGVGFGVLFLLTYFASRGTEKWQLEKHIERCRLASRFFN